MHPISLPRPVVERVRRRRGRLHIRDSIPAARTALLVVDMQNAYLADGAPAEVPLARLIVPKVNRLAGAVRDKGGRVVWIQNTLSVSRAGAWSPYFELREQKLGDAMRRALTEGSEGHALWKELDVDPADHVVSKTRYSAFAGASRLDEMLRSSGIDSVIIAGTATNVCCESTARDAMMRDFHVVFVSDATASRSDEEHLATLCNVIQFFGDVFCTEDVIARLQITNRAQP